MELFGVQELPNSKSITTPGWAYVPDTLANSASAALQPSSRKRAARNQPNASAHEHTAKQDAKILRELAALEKESHKDVQIPVPIRHRDNAGRVSHGKSTPAVRKILQSQKTFANHLSDAEALAALAASQPQTQAQAQAGASTPAGPASRASPASSTPKPTSTTSQPASMGKRSYRRKGANNTSTTTTPQRRVSTAAVASASATNPTTIKSEAAGAGGGGDGDATMADAPEAPTTSSILTPLPPSLELPPHPADHDPLLRSRIPPVPTDAELAALIAAPPLTYLEARGGLTEDNWRKPPRCFCEICGYWGRVRCTKCGSRVCALECLRTHKEDCYTRYGA
ncbi:MAG: hypothetical protein M1818_005935 [Claussenomyces sp. TS43310]|nr:MAG: hypothetical protein M1818_005935 [Claussenomyces sp. TS43310]